MKNDKRNRINKLKNVQKQREFKRMLESKNYPPHQLLDLDISDEIWSKINRGRVIERVEEISLECLRTLIVQIFPAREKLGTVLNFNTDSFILQFDKSELVCQADKFIEEISKDKLLYWFIFSIDLNQILLLEESEYGYYERERKISCVNE